MEILLFKVKCRTILKLAKICKIAKHGRLLFMDLGWSYRRQMKLLITSNIGLCLSLYFLWFSFGFGRYCMKLVWNCLKLVWHSTYACKPKLRKTEIIFPVSGQTSLLCNCDETVETKTKPLKACSFIGGKKGIL